MIFDADLQSTERWILEDLPPEMVALLNEGDPDCLVDDGGCLDRGLVLHLVEESVYGPQPDTVEWVLAAIKANPGIWTARLCRAMHGRRNVYRDIAWCGSCDQYANPRRRRRAGMLPPKTLPGFKEAAYQLHPPCSSRGLTWLRHQVYRLRSRGLIHTRRERRPDIRQPRGWDVMTTLYPGSDPGRQEVTGDANHSLPQS